MRSWSIPSLLATGDLKSWLDWHVVRALLVAHEERDSIFLMRGAWFTDADAAMVYGVLRSCPWVGFNPDQEDALPSLASRLVELGLSDLTPAIADQLEFHWPTPWQTERLGGAITSLARWGAREELEPWHRRRALIELSVTGWRHAAVTQGALDCRQLPNFVRAQSGTDGVEMLSELSEVEPLGHLVADWISRS